MCIGGLITAAGIVFDEVIQSRGEARAFSGPRGLRPCVAAEDVAAMAMTNRRQGRENSPRILQNVSAASSERNHRGKDNVLLFPSADHVLRTNDEPIECKERLGGLLKFYHRKAA